MKKGQTIIAKKDNRIDLRITDDQYRKLKILAFVKKKSVSELLRGFIETNYFFYERDKKAREHYGDGRVMEENA